MPHVTSSIIIMLTCLVNWFPHNVTSQIKIFHCHGFHNIYYHRGDRSDFFVTISFLIPKGSQMFHSLHLPRLTQYVTTMFSIREVSTTTPLPRLYGLFHIIHERYDVCQLKMDFASSTFCYMNQCTITPNINLNILQRDMIV